jgi:hypothetical protein
MKEFDAAESLHNELDSGYAVKLFHATSNNKRKEIAKYTEMRRTTDAAYFLLIFGTFERYLTGKADAAVQLRVKKAQYRSRRAWDTLLKGSKFNTAFLNRARVVLDQQGPDFQNIQRYYGVRNDLAHEGATTKLFSIASVVADLKSALKQAKR